MLSATLKNCVVPEAFLLCSFTDVSGIRRISLGSVRSGAEISFDVTVEPSFLDFSVVDEQIYWTNTKEMVC